MTKRVSCLICVLGLFGCAQPGSETADETETAGAALAAEDCPCRQKRADPPPAPERADMSQIDLARAPSKGPVTAPVTIALFCDFECPYCKRLQPRLEEIEKTYSGSVRIVFKQLPLPMHEHARLAAKAALAADEQGRFWELHELMFRQEHGLDRENLEALAERAGLDMPKFRSALESEALDRRLDQELTDADRVGARGTPTVFINGKKITGAQPLETFQQAIDEALKQR